ncbi:pyroglutamyl-peptidase 1-like [Homarus americanus]|uniref:Pyroglutamyl-peptidase 1-like n=1 Tax=Homarus americanus TaxID=6706 RepID=A0A8J5NDG5_HOMAM|nr:pyroglutamyl-peptidase 1-like [Homarus americanus]XP_042214169.1 pyroglutamyl-peptidase 1-like [Homarus americanus]KAG7177544.1 Pyroglutamyl-peptidase 1-like [Homarus americanus]
MGNMASLLSNNQLPVIYITAFDKYWTFSNNSSKEAVNKLDIQNLEQELGVQIIKETFDVSYKKLKHTIPQRWEELKPKLVVHVGMSPRANGLKLECVAHNLSYEYNDNDRSVPENFECIFGGETKIRTGICMETISRAINENKMLKLSSTISDDAGKFICEYEYYLSLSQDKSRSVFIHVPPISTEHSVQDIADALGIAIKELYHQVDEVDSRR